MPVDPTTFPDEDESKSLALVRTRSEEPHSTGQVPRIGSMGSTLPLGTSVDLYEKYLLSYCESDVSAAFWPLLISEPVDFTELPTKMFGFHKDALYCPYRTDAARTMQKSPSALHWILVIAEQQMNKYAPEQSRAVGLDQSILKRRANGYGVLRNLFNNPNFDLEDAIITLRYAISAECYVAHADASIEHLKALDSLLQRPGMIKFFAANMDRTALSLANLKRGYVNAPIPIKSANDFDNIKTMIFHNLRRLQILSKQNHVELIRHATTTYLRQNDGNGPGQPTPDMFQSNGDPQVSLLGRYISVKKSTLFSAYTSETMNATCNPNIKYSLQAGLLELFYGLNMTLASFGGQNLADRIMFLQRLKSVLDTSSERSLTASAITALVDRVREQYYSECFSREERTTKEVDMCTFGINILKIFALMDGESRTQLTTAVRAWLLSDISMDSSMQEEDLTEEDLVSMEDQVTRSWWKEHLTSKAAHSASLSPAP